MTSVGNQRPIKQVIARADGFLGHSSWIFQFFQCVNVIFKTKKLVKKAQGMANIVNHVAQNILSHHTVIHTKVIYGAGIGGQMVQVQVHLHVS